MLPRQQELSSRWACAQVEGRTDGTSIILSLESKSSRQLEAARDALITDLPAGTILGEQRNSATL